MQWRATPVMLNLLAGAEAVGQNEGLWIDFANAGQEDVLADSPADFISLICHSECSRHSAAALRRTLHLDLKPVED